jgi:thiol-disulfide isomerase/thioredoxin
MSRRRWVFLLGLLAVIPMIGHAQGIVASPLVPYVRDLLVLQGDALVPLKSDECLKVPYTLLYFGAGWCPDCRRFSPELVAAYDGQPVGLKRFGVVLLTMDKTEEGMLQFMRTERMKWPALAFAKAGSALDLRRYYSDRGIPCLAVIDPAGTIVLQSKTDRDATAVLRQLQEKLKGGP